MVIIFLADGFELVEAMTPVDMLKRAGKNVITMSVTDSPTVISSCGVNVLADTTVYDYEDDLDCEYDNDFKNEEIEAVILPGGMPGAKNLRECEFVTETVLKANSENKVIGAICAAPYILGELGLLRGRKATCYPGFEDKLNGAEISEENCVRDGNIITAAGMGAALAFSAELVSALCGRDKAEEILRSIIA